MLIVVAFPAAFLLLLQINPATNKKITAQNYCPPCQLGKLPSSRISTDILALRAQNLQQLGASPDQKSQSRTLCSLLTASQQSTKYHRLTANTIVHRKIAAHSKMQNLCSRQKTIVLSPHSPQHPSPSNGPHIPLFPSLIPPCRLTQLLHNHPRPPSFVPH
jgi:hypothetical protein